MRRFTIRFADGHEELFDATSWYVDALGTLYLFSGVSDPVTAQNSGVLVLAVPDGEWLRFVEEVS